MSNTIRLYAEAAYGHTGQYVARVTGRDPKWGLALSFIGRRSGKRGEMTEELVDEPGLYAERDVDRKGNKKDLFPLVWRDAKGLRVTRLDRDEAMGVARRIEDGDDASEIGRQLRIAALDRTLTEQLAKNQDEPIEVERWSESLEVGSVVLRSVRVTDWLAEIRRLRQVGEAGREALLAEKAKLLARLAEIEGMLASANNPG